jgi:hypothetical protein
MVMHLRRTLPAALLAASMGALLPPAPAHAQAGSGTADRPVDVKQLPVSVERISRELRQSAVREERDGMNLRYFVEVYAQAPRIQLFTPQDNLLNGPVPYGAPTHREILDVITPREFRSPAMDFNALFYWLANKAKKDK